MPDLDCGDNSCYFATSKGGMRTNGGCRCFSNAGFSKGIASKREMLLEVLKLQSELEQARQAEICACLRAEKAEDQVEQIRQQLSR